MICDIRTTSVFKLKPIWAQISRSDWCLGASRCGGNALSRDGLLRSTPGWWGQQHHGVFFDMSRTSAHLFLGETCDSADWMLCEVTTPEKWDGISRHWQHRAWWSQIKGIRPNLGRWHPKSHYGIPCVLAAAIIQEIPLSASALTPEVRAQSRFGHHWWDPFARTGAPIWSIGGRCFSSCFFLFVFSLFVSFLFQSILVSWCTYDTCDTI